MAKVREHAMWRSRWAAIGAAVAVTLGFGSIGRADATVASGERSIFVPITPCRLLDTRGLARVGPRGIPVNAEEEFRAQVWGANGDCTIPSGAGAVMMNVTVVAPATAGFVTVWPSTVGRPNTSNLNFSAGQAVPNAVTTKVGSDGGVKFYSTATTELIADIVGYYEDHNHNDQYAAIGSGGGGGGTVINNYTSIVQGGNGNIEGSTVRYVTADGTPTVNGNNLRAAVALGGTAIVRLAPGTYDLGANTLAIPNGVVVQGASRIATTVTASSSPLVTMSGTSELSNLTVTGGAGVSASVMATNSAVNLRLRDLDLLSPIGSNLGAIYNPTTATVTVDNVTTRSRFGVTNTGGLLKVTNSDIDSFVQDGPGTLIVQNTVITQAVPNQAGLFISNGGTARLDNVDIKSDAYAVREYDTTGTILISNSRVWSPTIRYVQFAGTVRCVNSVRGNYITAISAACT